MAKISAGGKKAGKPESGVTPMRSRGRPATNKQVVGPDALIAMTLDLLGNQSPHEITRASLARHAGVDPGLIRYYFKNRDSLMQTATQELTRRLQERGAKALEGDDLTPAERICIRAQALLSFKLEYPFYHRLMAEEMAQSEDDASRTLFANIASSAIDRYNGYLEAGVAEGTLRDVDPAFLYMAIVGMCDFFVIASPKLEQFIQNDGEPIETRYARFICDLLLHGLTSRA